MSPGRALREVPALAVPRQFRVVTATHCGGFSQSSQQQLVLLLAMPCSTGTAEGDEAHEEEADGGWCCSQRPAVGHGQALIACNECNDAASLSRGSRTCQLLICCCLFVHDSNVFTSLGDVKVPQIWSWETVDFLCRGAEEAGGRSGAGCGARDALTLGAAQTACPALSPKSRAHGSNRGT